MLISTTQRECSRGPRRAVSVLSRLPSIFKFPPNAFKVQGRLQICLNILFFSSAGRVCFWSRAESGREPAGRSWRSSRRQDAGVTHSIFTYPWGIHFPGSLSIRCIKRSMATYSEIKHNSSGQAGKQAVFRKMHLVMYIRLDMTHMSTTVVSCKSTNKYTWIQPNSLCWVSPKGILQGKS